MVDYIISMRSGSMWSAQNFVENTRCMSKTDQPDIL